MAAQTVHGVAESGAHVQGSSANTATPATITPPKAANGAAKYTAIVLSARTNAAYVTFDGSAPTAANGIEIPVGIVLIIRVALTQGVDLKFCSANAAAASILNALFLT